MTVVFSNGTSLRVLASNRWKARVAQKAFHEPKPEANPKHIEGSSERDRGFSKAPTQDHAQSARASRIGR